MGKKRGTYLITFGDGKKIICGNNYKPWTLHATEYAWSRYQDHRPVTNLLESVEFSDKPFVDDGGLKYATPEAYQEIIVEQLGDKAYGFEDIDFYPSNRDKKKLEEELKYWGLV